MSSSSRVIAEGPQPLGHRAAVDGRGLRGLEEAPQLDAVFLQPAAIGLLAGDLPLDLVVFDDAAFLGIDQEHASRLQAALALDLLGRELDHAHFAGQHHQSVGGHDVAAGPQAVAVQGAADQPAVGEDHGGRAVPGLHDRRVILVERPLVGGNMVAGAEGLGDHHHQGVRGRAAGPHQQFHAVVEAGRVAAAGLQDGIEVREVLAQRRAGHRRSRRPASGWHCPAAC